MINLQKSNMSLYDQLMKNEVSTDSVCLDGALERMKQKLNEAKSKVIFNSTALLWLQHMTLDDLLWQFIKAKRTGNWSLYLHTLAEMLPYFATAGHNN